MSKNNTAAQKRPVGPMGGRHQGPGMPGEKPKEFKKTMGKLIKYCKSSLPMIIISFVFAIASVILTLNIPNILADATDTLFIGVFRKTVYATMEKNVADTKYGTMEELAKDYPYLSDLMAAEDKELLAVLMRSDSETEEENGEAVTADKIPEKYQTGLMETYLGAKPQIDIDSILKILTLMIILVMVSAAISYVQSFILAGVAQKVSYRFRRDIDNKISKLPLKYYDTTTNGEVLSYLTNDVDTISTTLNQSLAQLVTAITTLVGVLVMMIRISLIMTAIAILIVPITLLLVTLVVKFSQKHFMRQQKYLGSVNGHIEEMYAGHKEVELYNHQDESVAKFDEYNTKLASASKNSQFLSGLMMPIMTFVGNLGYVASCVVGGVLTINGKISIGNIQAFIQYLRQFNQPIAQMGSIVNTLQSTAAAAERVFGFIEAEEEGESGTKIPQNVEGNVEFSHVKFGYNPDKIIINDFSAKIKAGDRVAIVGPTGAGKTTMVKLLMRYYELNDGSISLDGTDVKEFTREGLRGELGMVLQDTWLYNGTIMDNIRYGKLDATDEEVVRAAKIACADHFIRTLEGGYNFVINEEAGNISQGQKQLLTIARAVLNDPKVLILDEATSSVDTRTEVLIQKAMDRLMQGRTSFIIAHRLSTIRDADLILVMKDGDIIEQGTHDALMEQKGFYENLYNSQFAD